MPISAVAESLSPGLIKGESTSAPYARDVADAHPRGARDRSAYARRFGDAVTARERSLPIDRLFPFGRGLRGGGFISTQLQGGRGARLAS